MAQVKIKSLEQEIITLKKEKENLKEQVDLSQQVIKNYEKELWGKKKDDNGSPCRNPREIGEEDEETKKKIADLQSLLDDSIKAAQKLEEQLEAVTKEKETLEADVSDLQAELEGMKSQQPSPTSSGVSKATKKSMLELVNADAADKIKKHIKYFLGRQCKFAHTKKRVRDLAQQVWVFAQEKCKVNEETFEDFFAVYEPVILEGVTAHRQYIQTRTQSAAECESIV